MELGGFLGIGLGGELGGLDVGSVAHLSPRDPRMHRVREEQLLGRL